MVLRGGWELVSVVENYMANETSPPHVRADWEERCEGLACDINI